MKLAFIKPVYAHCDLPCGVYDPAQAKIEAESLKAILEKYESLDDHNKTRAIMIKEERAELVKKHLMVLWADYFKPEHLEKYPDLHEKFWLAIKQASNVKHSTEVSQADKLLKQVDEISDIFWKPRKVSPLIIRRVVGESMLPTLKAGQIVVGLTYKKPSPGQIVIINLEGREIVKRLKKKRSGELYILGDNEAWSTDSRVYGWISGDSLLATVVWPR